MKDEHLLDALFFDRDVSLTDMHKGLTNKNYKLTLRQEDYVLRIPYADADHIVERHHEALALQALKDQDIDVETIYFDEASGYKLTRYLKNAYTYEECPFPDKLERTALLMKRFHKLHTSIGVAFDPVQRLRQYQSHITNCPFTFPHLDTIIEELNRYPQRMILCHNDWVSGNILFTKEHTYLIDYEYAADNDPLFDVISFLSENYITEADRIQFYHHYFQDQDIPYHRLMLWEAFEDALWCCWAWMMWEHRQDTRYQVIAKEKHEGYQAILHSLWKQMEDTEPLDGSI